jgi:hypothetical protein
VEPIVWRLHLQGTESTSSNLVNYGVLSKWQKSNRKKLRENFDCNTHTHTHTQTR